MSTKRLLTLPIPGSGADDFRLSTDGLTTVIAFGYFDEKVRTDYIGGVRFTNVVAFRYSNEANTHNAVSAAYDAVAEIEDSLWLRELEAALPSPPPAWPFKKRHFALYLSNSGYFEIIASSVEMLEPRQGPLND